jgi:hypothetical protein
MVVSTVIPATTESGLRFFIVCLYRHIAEHKAAFSDECRLPRADQKIRIKKLDSLSRSFNACKVN